VGYLGAASRREEVDMTSRHLGPSFLLSRRAVLPTLALLAGLAFLPVAGNEPDSNLPNFGVENQSLPAAPAKPLTPEMTINRWSISDLQLSPDGSKLALVVSEPAKPSGQRRNIWIYDFSTRVLRQFTASTKSDTRPRWSPDGRRLAFLSSRDGENQIYLIPVDGGEARPCTESKTGIDSFEWSPDGRRLAFETSAPKTDEEEKKEKDKDDARLVGKPDNRALLQVMEVESKALKTLVQGAWRISEYVWAPDGVSLIAIATDHPQQELFSDKIYRVNATDGQMTLITAPAGPFGRIRVSMDGKTLAYTGCRGDGPDPHDLIILPAGGGETRNLTARSIDRPVGLFVWENPETIFTSASMSFGTSFFTVTRDGRAEKSEWTAPLLAGSYAKGKNGLAFVGESATQAPELWVASSPGHVEKVSHFNKDWDDVKLVQPQVIRYPSFDKREIEAALFKPEGPSLTAGKPAAVVLVHGGPTGAWTDRFDSWAQLLAAHGFVVLSPNVRGSTGYGYDFMVINRFDWGGGDFKDVMAGMDWLIQKGIADPNRIGIGGWSYGGYMAAWAVTQTTRFKASVSGAPMTDLAFEYGSEAAGINIGDTWALGNPYENLPLFTGRSPMTYVKKVKTPTLLLCGENDTTDPVEQCYQFHRGLRRFGVETELVVYPREGHGVREEKHRIDVLNRVVGWFEKYLKK
jgi:dipeptidyl aminopeptidase/acylaminoacyl peptidase